MLMIFNFLRCVCVFVMVWLPAVVFLIDISLFIQLTPLWILGYYAVCFYFINWLFRVPFAVLVKHYNETHEEEASEDTDGSQAAAIEE